MSNENQGIDQDYINTVLVPRQEKGKRLPGDLKVESCIVPTCPNSVALNSWAAERFSGRAKCQDCQGAEKRAREDLDIDLSRFKQFGSNRHYKIRIKVDEEGNRTSKAIGIYPCSEFCGNQECTERGSVRFGNGDLREFCATNPQDISEVASTLNLSFEKRKYTLVGDGKVILQGSLKADTLRRIQIDGGFEPAEAEEFMEEARKNGEAERETSYTPVSGLGGKMIVCGRR